MLLVICKINQERYDKMKLELHYQCVAVSLLLSPFTVLPPPLLSMCCTLTPDFQMCRTFCIIWNHPCLECIASIAIIMAIAIVSIMNTVVVLVVVTRGLVGNRAET